MMKHLLVLVVPSALVLCGGCAGKSAPAKTPAELQLEADLAPVGHTAWEAAPPVQGDVQFTVSDRRAKAAPSDDAANATTLQPIKSNTSGMVSTGVTTQRVRVSQ